MTSLNRILSTDHFLDSHMGTLWADLAKEEAERTLVIFTGELVINNIGVCCFFNPKPVLLDNFILASAIQCPLLPFLNFGTYINITCEPFGSSLAIFTSVFFLIVSYPLSWTLSIWWQRYISYIHWNLWLKQGSIFLFLREAVFSVCRALISLWISAVHTAGSKDSTCPAKNTWSASVGPLGSLSHRVFREGEDGPGVLWGPSGSHY